MKGKSYSTVERVFILSALDASGDIKGVCRKNQIAEQTLRRWRRQMGDLKANETLKREHQKQRNDELEKILADSMLISRVVEAAYRKFAI
jgi:transposase-like protein